MTVGCAHAAAIGEYSTRRFGILTPCPAISPTGLTREARGLVVAVSRTRIHVIAAGASILLAVFGLFWSGARFGWTAGDRTARLQRYLTERMATRVAVVTSAATRAAEQGALVAAAAASRDRVADLFARLDTSPRFHVDAAPSVTIWVPTGTSPDYRALAWTDGPSENVGPGRLDRAPLLYGASDAAGLRLIDVQPILHEGQRIGAAVAEVKLSDATRDD